MMIHSHFYEKTSRTHGTINANFRNPLKIFQLYPVIQPSLSTHTVISSILNIDPSPTLAIQSN